MAEITAVLTAYRRPHLLAEQVDAVLAQTVPPREIWLWANEPTAKNLEAFCRLSLDRIVTCNHNAHVHARFALALTAPTEFVAIFDDDTIPGPRWFENCRETFAKSPGILGSAGVRLREEGYSTRTVHGWHDPSDQVTEVDLVGHAWFQKTAWIHHLFSEPPMTGTNGEDIELSARAWRAEGIRTFCPPHPRKDHRLWGSTRGEQLGGDAQAMSRRRAHLEERNRIVAAEIAAGWQPLFQRDRAARSYSPSPRSVIPAPSGPPESPIAPAGHSSQPAVPRVDQTVPLEHADGSLESPMQQTPNAQRILWIGRNLDDRAEALKRDCEAEIVGIEIDKRVVEQPRQILDQILPWNLEDPLPIASGESFNEIHCDLGVLESVKRPLDLLRSLRSVVNPLGRLLATIRNARRHDVVAGLLNGRWTASHKQNGDLVPVRFFTRREIEKLFFRSGWVIQQIRPIPGAGHEEWQRRGRPGDASVGSLHVGGLSPSEAEEFYTDGYEIQAVPAANGLTQSATTTTAIDEGSSGDSVAIQIESLRTAYPWPAAKPSVPIPREHLGWFADGAQEVLSSEVNTKTRLIVELGTWLGMSTRYIADRAPNATVITIDHFKGSPEHQRRPEWRAMLPTLREVFQSLSWSYRDRIVSLGMTTAEALEAIASYDLEPDLVFFDAAHDREAVLADLRQCRQLFPRTTMVGDDYDDTGVREAVCEFASEIGLDVSVVGRGWKAWKFVDRARNPAPSGPAPLLDAGLTSIVILTHGQLEYTRLCLDSIRRFTDEPYELIVVDNASPDATVEYLRAQPDVRLLENQENRGFPAGVNQGIAVAQGQQVLLLNNDTIVTTGWLSRMLQALQSDPSIGLVGPVSNQISGEQQVEVSYGDLLELDGFAWDWGKAHDRQLTDTDRLVGFCLLIQREVIDKIGVLDEQFGMGNFEDDDYSLRARQAGYRTVVARDSFVHHFGGRTFGGSGVDFGTLMQKNRELFLKKWGQDPASLRGQSAPVARFLPPARPDQAPPPIGKLKLVKSPSGGLLLERAEVKVSLCMIVRDNAPTLPACLESIRPWMDEMVIADTGSTDETPKIVQDYGGKLYHFPWCDDFSAARNESINHAKGEWVFWMDSDDTITPECGRGLRALIYGQHDPSIGGYVMQVHCPGTGSDGAPDMVVVDHVKLFRNRPDVRFDGRIHEQILGPIRQAGGELGWTELYVVHSGSDRSPEGLKRKIERDLRILHKELHERPDHPFTLFNLGMTYADCQRFEESVEFLRRSIAHSSPGESHLRKAYALLMMAQTQLGRLDEARETSRLGLAVFPDDGELRFRLGILLDRLGCHAEAARAYRDVLNNPEARHLTSIHRGIGGYMARQNLAVSLEEAGDLQGAQREWRQIIRDMPGYRGGWRGLVEVLLRARNYSGALSVVDELGFDGASEYESLFLRGRVALARQDWSVARENLEACAAALPDDAFIRSSLCELYFMTGDRVLYERALHEHLRLQPDNASSLHNLGTLYLMTKRPADAVNFLQAASRQRPGALEILRELASALKASHRVSEACDVWREILRIRPGDEDATRELGIYGKPAR